MFYSYNKKLLGKKLGIRPLYLKLGNQKKFQGEVSSY